MEKTDQPKLKILIADDEPLARERLRDLLAGDAEIGAVAEAKNGRETIEKILSDPPDILLLDVQMPYLNGLQVLETVGAAVLQKIGAIIFVTAFDAHALRAFDFHALDYLLKPFARERFAEMLNRAKNQIRLKSQAAEIGKISRLLENLTDGEKKKPLEWITVKKNERIVLHRAADVRHVEASANYAVLQFEKERETIRETMDNLEKNLDPQIFIRIHRSTIINVNFIREVQTWFQNEHRVVMKNGREFTLTSRYRDAFIKFFKGGF